MLVVGCRRVFGLVREKLPVCSSIWIRGLAMANRERVKFDSANKAGQCDGVLQGDVTQTKKGLIVLQEWWGLNDQIQEEAEQLGKLGNFVTLVPDLYRGKVTIDAEEAGHFMGNLDWKGAIDDIRGAAKFLLSKGCLRVGVTGFCMGGALSLASAALVQEISASAPFYGIPSPGLADPTTIKIPLQLHFGEQDDIAGFSSPKDYEALRQKLQAANVQFEFFTYPAKHAFTNHSGPNYDETCCKTAFSRAVEFFQKNLS